MGVIAEKRRQMRCDMTVHVVSTPIAIKLETSVALRFCLGLLLLKNTNLVRSK